MADLMYTGAKALIERDGKVLAIKTETGSQEFWDIPGGRVEEGETVNEALERELKEEVNLTSVSVGEPIGTYSFRIGENREGEQVNIIVFKVETDQDPSLSDSEEESHLAEMKWMEPEELAQVKEGTRLEELSRILRNVSL